MADKIVVDYGHFGNIVLLILWIAGFVLAKGFWSTFFCIIPFYAWYIVIERLCVMYLN